MPSDILVPSHVAADIQQRERDRQVVKLATDYYRRKTALVELVGKHATKIRNAHDRDAVANICRAFLNHSRFDTDIHFSAKEVGRMIARLVLGTAVEERTF